MSFDTWTLYVGAILLMMMTPGPSHLLMLSTSASNGFRKSLATAAGDLTANFFQILLAGLGLAALITASKTGFAIIKWGGVAYLIWLGVQQIRKSFNGAPHGAATPRASLKQLWLRGFITSAANPKAVVFFAALFPQFINPAAPLAAQVAILGATYLVIDGLFLSAYGKGASWLSERLRHDGRKWVDRVAGAGIIGAAIMLGLKTNHHQ